MNTDMLGFAIGILIACGILIAWSCMTTEKYVKEILNLLQDAEIDF